MFLEGIVSLMGNTDEYPPFLYWLPGVMEQWSLGVLGRIHITPYAILLYAAEASSLCSAALPSLAVNFKAPLVRSKSMITVWPSLMSPFSSDRPKGVSSSL